ncbi:hypothetical protein HMPREF0970_01012 [Schaalia odontolytica F0309]|uniref:Uncharacterized protein n=1 Tax=Schaalia odontolytica F0309 TaxID=649742 RepID=D4TYI7_9ACTO|nr:hypothetical protein HMPREF0970_01012 [Schaalia odontolytica F0309]
MYELRGDTWTRQWRGSGGILGRRGRRAAAEQSVATAESPHLAG